ncbi:hypothetical protein CK203_103098 [Vitis vinifera]|uniref:Retrotransposon gag domain-containing protein n=1 Tax=Vitis vinifera TaxID=29760 RepID=A0A438CVP4_VITVI|nr:hypothetical protein CK203_103098 [Vitis vinifera]
MEKSIYTIETWEDFKRKIKRQFYPEDVAYLARKNMRHLKHTSSIRNYVKEFSSLMLDISNMTEEELLFNFMDNLQGWAEQELRHQGVQDLDTTKAVVESLIDYKRGDSSKVESLEDSHATGGGDEVSKDHNAPRMESGKTPNIREGKGLFKEEGAQCHDRGGGTRRQSTYELNVAARSQKGSRAEVAHTHMDKVTKEKVNSMGKRKQHSKHQKCMYFASIRGLTGERGEEYPG